MTRKLLLSIGECMIEMVPAESGQYALGFAGDTLNTAWCCKALLAANQWDVSYLTRLGKDAYSGKIRHFLAENGIDTSFITTDEKRQPGLYLVEISNGERSFTYWRETSAARALADDEAHLKAALEAADVIYFSGITLAILSPDRRKFLIDAIGEARRRGKMTVFDPNIRLRLWENADNMRKTLAEAAHVAAVCLPSFDDEAALFGDPSPEACVRRYLNYGCDTVAVKNGGGPIWFSGKDGLDCRNDFLKVEPMDTTGAGDAFNGGLLAALLENHGLNDAITAGHRVAAKVILHRGALMPMEHIT